MRLVKIASHRPTFENVKLTEEQLELKRLAHDFAEREIAPRAKECDQEGHLAPDLTGRFKELGLLNLRIPESLGGLGLTNLDAVVITEEFATACSGIATFAQISEAALTPLLLCGTEAQKRALLPGLASEGGVFGLALGPNLLTGEVKNGAIYLNGECAWVANLTVSERIFVRFSLEGKNGVFGAYIASRGEGLTSTITANVLGRKAQDTGSLIVNNLAVQERDVFNVGESLLESDRQLACQNFPIEAALAVGIGNAALKNAIAYSKERKTFGKEIFQHQAVSFMLADMAKDITAARLLVWQAARAADQGLDLPNLYLSAKAYAQEMAIGVATDAVQIYGGYGYSREYPVEKLMRDAKTLELPVNPAYELKAGLGRLLLA